MFVYCPPKEIPKIESKTFPDGKRYYMTPDGKKLPSVTTVVGAQKKQAIMEWRQRVGEEVANKISKQATSRGTNVHTLCEHYLNNEPKPPGVVMPDAKEMFISLKPLLDKINNIHYQEVGLWSTQLGLAGRVDCIAEYEGVLSVIDFKTSKKLKDIKDIQDYFWQTTAYALMYEELVGQPIDDIVIIMAVQDSEAVVFKQKTQDHIEGLVRAIDYYHKHS
jgi:ATP-dependent exoDNAse (exonuclease V) beta subunit